MELCDQRSLNERRHTSVTDRFQFKLHTSSDETTNESRSPTSGHLLGEELSRSQACNKSDFSINYQANEESETSQTAEPEVDVMSHKLAVPERFDWPESRQQDSNPIRPRRSLGYYEERQAREGEETGRGAASGESAACFKYRKSTQLIRNEEGNLIREADVFRKRSIQLMNQQHQISSSSSKPLLSLKEINKRLVKIKFKTRRQLNAGKYLNSPVHLQDVFIIVYAVNDR